MTKHRTIAGFVAVGLLAAVTTAATMEVVLPDRDMVISVGAARNRESQITLRFGAKPRGKEACQIRSDN